MEKHLLCGDVSGMQPSPHVCGMQPNAAEQGQTLPDATDCMCRSEVMRNDNDSERSEHDGQVNINAEDGLGHVHDDQIHEKAMEEMHGQATHRLSFESWLPHNIGSKGASFSHMEQMDHVIESYVPFVGLSSDGSTTPKKKSHILTMVSF
jgi:hypothetical protein